MTNKFIAFIWFSIFIFFVGCKDERDLTIDFKEAYSKNFNVKEALKKKNISSPEKIKLDNPDYYFIFGKSYFNSYGYDPFSKFLINKACSPDNLFKKEATETLIKILAENKEFENLKKLLRNNLSLIEDKEEIDFFSTFLNGENLSKIKSVPPKKEFAFILYEIIKKDEKDAKKIDNIEKIITFFSKLNPKDPFFVKNDFLMDEIFQETGGNSFINLARDYFTKKRTASEKDIVLALEGVKDPARAEFLKKICSNIFGGKIFFLSLEQTRDKSQKWFSYQYALEAFNYKPKNFALSFAQNALKNFQDKDNFNYNIRAKILYAEYNFNKKWASDVVDFVNDYPKSYHSKSLLNLALRSAIYQNKKDIIRPLLSKIDVESMDSINQSENYYIFYLIDKDEKWKNILLEKFPLSYGALVLNGNNVKIRESEYKKKSANYTETGKTIFRKINRLLEFDLSADAKNISTSRLNDDEKIEVNDIFYNYYIYKEDYYNAVKIAGIYAELIYGENIKNIDKETLKRLFPFHYENFVFEYSKEFDIEPSLIYAVMREESRYKKDIVSFANAIGLMQVIPKTGDFISSKIKMSSYDLTNPADNIRMGAYYLQYLKSRYEDYPFILSGYNAGPSRTREWVKIYKNFDKQIAYELIPIEETRYYIKKVMRSYYIYKSLYQNA